MSGRAARVELLSVSKRYGTVTAVRDVSFVVESGRLVTLLGPSGCGKTTTLRLVAGLELPTAGQILIGGEDVTHQAASARDVSMVFQSYALFPHLTVLDNAAYGLVVSGRPRRAAHAAARQVLATVGLSGFDRRLPSELSGGQQQRVAVARALVLEPRVLLFDEPLSNLDAGLRRQMRQEIRDLQRRLDLTVIYVTHDQQEALAISDRIIVMNRAMIAQEGSPRELYEHPRDRFVASFMGEANLIKGRLIHGEGGYGRVLIGSVECVLPHRGLPEGEVAVAIRPQSIRLSRAPASAAELPGRIVRAAYLGVYAEYMVATEVGELLVTTADVVESLPEGTQVSLILGDGAGMSLLEGNPKPLDHGAARD